MRSKGPEGARKPDESRRKTKPRLESVGGGPGALTVTVAAADGRSVRTFPFNPGDSVVFGRAGADVVLPDTLCSRRHFDLMNSGGLVVLRDCGSTNGTFLNGEQVVSPRVLGDGDEIRAGDLRIAARGTLSGPSPQVLVEIAGGEEVHAATKGTGKLTIALPKVDLDARARVSAAGSVEVAGSRPREPHETQRFLPGVWQICEAAFDDPYGEPDYGRLVKALVFLGGASRACMVRLDGGVETPSLLAEARASQYDELLPVPPELVRACDGPGAAVGISSVGEDRRYAGLMGEGPPPDVAVVAAAVASLGKHYGVLHTEWRRPADMERTFVWVWSIAGQLGLLTDRNGLASELRRMNERLSEMVVERTRELATALDRLSNIQRAMSQTGKLATIGELAASLVHELNNPLTAIAGNAQLLSGEGAFDSDERVATIARQSMRAHRIVKNILSLARRQKPKVLPVRLGDVLRNVAELVAHELNMHGVVFLADVAPDFPRVDADPVQLEHVFINLAVNSCHAVGDRGSGRITVTAREEEGTAVVTFADDGPGIAPEIMARLFEPFITTKPEGEGTGLGLAICRWYLEAMGGSIEAADAPGGGALFALRLPVQGGRAHASGRRTGEAEAAGPVRVLLVDDSRDVLNFMRRVAEMAGMEAEAAASKAEAMGVLARREVDVLVTDVNMPGGGGPDLFREAKAAGHDFTGRVVFVSGTVYEGDILQAVEEAKGRFIEKPFQASALVRIVRELARARA